MSTSSNPLASQEGTNKSLAARVRSGETMIGTFAALGSPLTVEICGRAGFDWVLIDLERMSRLPWNFGDGPDGIQATS
jgi:hypothetical protein